MTERDYVDLAHAIDTATEPYEDADGFLIGWSGRGVDAMHWTAQEGDE